MHLLSKSVWKLEGQPLNSGPSKKGTFQGHNDSLGRTGHSCSKQPCTLSLVHHRLSLALRKGQRVLGVQAAMWKRKSSLPLGSLTVWMVFSHHFSVFHRFPFHPSSLCFHFSFYIPNMLLFAWLSLNNNSLLYLNENYSRQNLLCLTHLYKCTHMHIPPHTHTTTHTH